MSSFSARWTSPQRRNLAAEVAFRLVGGEGFADLDLGTHEGRVDLRGFSLPGPDVLSRFRLRDLSGARIDGLIELRSVRWEGLDLSHSILPGLRFFDSDLVDCRFEKARLPDWKFWNSRVTSVDFVGCHLRGAVLGGSIKHGPTSWTDVRFARCDMRDTVMHTASFTRCEFDRCQLASVHFEGCRFDHVTFAGELRGVVFDSREIPGERADPGSMRSVDFSGSTLIDVDFWGCRFEDSMFPDEPGLVVFPNSPSVARRQLELLTRNASPQAHQVRDVLENLLRYPGREDADGYFSRADWVRGGIPGAAELAESTLQTALGWTDAGFLKRLT